MTRRVQAISSTGVTEIAIRGCRTGGHQREADRGRRCSIAQGGNLTPALAAVCWRAYDRARALSPTDSGSYRASKELVSRRRLGARAAAPAWTGFWGGRARPASSAARAGITPGAAASSARPLLDSRRDPCPGAAWARRRRPRRLGLREKPTRKRRLTRRGVSLAATLAAVMLALPALALAHLERPSYWPDPRPDNSVSPPAGGKVPKARSLKSAASGAGTRRRARRLQGQ